MDYMPGLAAAHCGMVAGTASGANKPFRFAAEIDKLAIRHVETVQRRKSLGRCHNQRG